MKKDLTEVIEFPEGIDVEMANNMIKLKGKAGEISQKIPPVLPIKITGRKLEISVKNSTKKEKKILKSFVAHIKKTIKGVNEKYVYKLQVCFVHFPVTISYDEQKREILIKNFLGETKPRIAKILPNVDLKIEGDKIILSSANKDVVGQSAANLETATKIRGRDRRIFQDGIWITEKGGIPI
jgi:large subunit ribosomal protein L6